MTTLVLLALGAKFLRFVYVDPKGYVRLYGDPEVRSATGRARQPDLSPNGRSFVYWNESDVVGGHTVREHDLRTGRERVLRKGSVRSAGYSADGRTIFFIDRPAETSELWALGRASGKARRILMEGEGASTLSEAHPQADGSLVVQDRSRLMRVGLRGDIMWSVDLGRMGPMEAPSPEGVSFAPGKPYRLLAGLWTQDADDRIVGSDGYAGAVWVFGAKTMEGRRITPRNLGAMRPHWTSDGTNILFVGGRAKGPQGIWSIRPDGSGLRFLVAGEEPSAGL